jgi:hypothetical protein
MPSIQHMFTAQRTMTANCYCTAYQCVTFIHPGDIRIKVSVHVHVYMHMHRHQGCSQNSTHYVHATLLQVPSSTQVISLVSACPLTSQTVSSTVLGHSTAHSRCHIDQGCCQCRPVWVLSRCMAQCSMAAGCHSHPCCRCCTLFEGRLGGQGSLQASTAQHSQLITPSMLLSHMNLTAQHNTAAQHATAPGSMAQYSSE